MWKYTSITENIINWEHLCFPFLQKEKKKKISLVQSSVIQSIWMYKKTQKVEFYLYLPISLSNLINSKHNSF